MHNSIEKCNKMQTHPLIYTHAYKMCVCIGGKTKL